jgi:hypothetical protein
MTLQVMPFVHEGRIVWTMTTNGYKYYTLNLIAWLREKAKVPWTLCVICCDSESYTFFRREGIPCISYEIATNKGQQRIAAFGTEDFAKWNKKKVELLKWFAENSKGLGITRTLYLDGDIVVQKDPWPVLELAFQERPTQQTPSPLGEGVLGLEFEATDVDFLFQCDCVGAEDHSGCGVICSGVIAQRIGEESYSRLYEFELEEWLAAERQDQGYIGRRLKTLGIPYKTLGRQLWGNGEWQKSKKWQTSDWVLLHYNYRVGDTKKAAMRSFGHWLLPY